jgi:DNA-binding NtrC family response regulator
MARATILVADDKALTRWSLAARLNAEGYRVLEADTGQRLLDRLAEGADLVLLDGRLADFDGLTLLRRIKELDQEIPVILLTASADVETAVEAMKGGACHVASLPTDLKDVAAVVERALETTRLRRDARHHRATAAHPYTLSRIVGISPAIAAVRSLVARVAVSPSSTVLLSGESGTGKDLVANVIHDASARVSQPFMSISCSALPEPLLESELFGHERGAVTDDARPQKRGLLETADGGTVLLDEISEMSKPLQAKLLQFLEEGSFRRVGGAEQIRVNVRVVAASNRDLGREVAGHRFRDDLFYRLNVLAIAMPALRTHREDIPLLVEHFIEGFDAEFRKCVRDVTPAAHAMLQQYQWPGNVRELRNVVERAILLSDNDYLDAPDFPSLAGGMSAGDVYQLPSTGVDLEKLERGLVIQALRRSGGNQTRAGSLLGLNRDQVRYRIEEFGLHTAGVAASDL